MTTSRAATSSILIVLLLAGGLAGCAPTSPTDSGDTGTAEEETSTDDGGFAGVTLPGTGDYAVPADAPIGGYELPDNQDSLPDGCSWTLYEDENVLAESNGPFVFVTDVTTRFVTDGCPDWVQFE